MRVNSLSESDLSKILRAFYLCVLLFHNVGTDKKFSLVPRPQPIVPRAGSGIGGWERD